MKETNRLTKEREANPLQIDELTRYLHGGERKFELRQRALKLLMEHPELLEQDYSFYDLSRAEKRKKTLKKMVDFIKLSEKESDKELLTTAFYILGEADASFLVRTAVSAGLFGGAIKGQGTDEQIAEYLPRLDNHSIIGCFCMTELGTGSYLQSLETTATYLPEKDEFVIHSPTLTSTKWWIGSAAQTATHTIVFAKLILKGEDLGTHNFIVQLRDKNFNLCPGITIGDVGPKRGDDGIDNGWVRFDQVHISRNQMLMKWSRVTAEGKYEKSELAQLAYGALIGGRVFVAKTVIDSVKKAVTIATRYCTVRDQHSIEGKCLLDYTTQQERLIGGMCSAYAFHFALDKLSNLFDKVTEELSHKDTTHLKDLHNFSAGFKGFAALWANDAINQCIFSLGGHGYSNLSGLPKILNDFAPSIPYEGDAIVLVQQTASYLVKAAGALKKGKELTGDSIQYLKKLAIVQDLKSTNQSDDDLSLEELREAAQWLSLFLIKESGTSLYKGMMKGLLKRNSDEEAWNANQLKLIQASKAHIMYLIIDNFANVINQEIPQALGKSGKKVIPILSQVAELFALRHIEEFLSLFYENNFFPLSRGEIIRKRILKLYSSLRPYTNQLVDAWGLPDSIIQTPLGRFDGEIYENYFKAVNEIPQDIKPPYWEEYLKPFLEKD